jgi:predicted DCC family thiol-disulfide oxidoreductase YuxK
LFYDGGCGLCHGVVLWTLARDRKAAFLFAPLSGDTFKARMPEGERSDLPDSIVLQKPGEQVLLKSAAVRAILLQIGGAWRVLGVILGMVPRPLADWGYDFVASIRHRLFKKPDDACPVVPPEWRTRFRS